MKSTIRSAKKPAAHSEREQAILDAAKFHSERIDQEEQINTNREFSNKPTGNSEFEQAVAEDVILKIDDKIAQAAYLIAQRRGFAPGDPTADWLQAEAELEGILRSGANDRRNGGDHDRRDQASKDRRSCSRLLP